MTRALYRGVVTDERTRDMVAEAEKINGASFKPTQGSYSVDVSASAGTHRGGGALDLSVNGMDKAKRDKAVSALRKVGFAAWYRAPEDGPWGAHIHAIAIGCPDLAASAARQVEEYKNGGDGLVGAARDPQAYLGVKPTTWEQYLRSKNRKPFPLPQGHSFGTPESSTVHDGTSTPDDEHNVKLIQARLGIGRYGRYGAVTRLKVMRWQAWRLMKPTGRVGSVTWYRLGL